MLDFPVLVVEDEPDGQELVSRMLTVGGMEAEVAADGETAWQMLGSKDYAAVVIDLALPGMDGVELFRQIRATDTLAHLPCIAITAYHTPELKQQCVGEGFDFYFAKPLDRTLFMAALNGLAEE